MEEQKERSESARFSSIGERIAVLENSVNGKGALMDQVKHLHDCVESLKTTVWRATGTLAALFILVKFLLGM